MSGHPKRDLSTPVLEARRLDVGSRSGYCLVRSRRRKDTDPSPPPEFLPEEAPARAAFAEYRDPDLCSCARMGAALLNKSVIVVVGGPVTLPPGVYTEEAIDRGEIDVGRLERAYDGKPWAFRYCPFEDDPPHLVDDQVPMPTAPDDGVACCMTMAVAVAHDRVDLPPPERHGRESPKFVTPGKAGTIFSVCPWCATSMLDLGIARLKRHYASKANP